LSHGIKLSQALEMISQSLGGDIRFHIDRKGIADENGMDVAPAPDEEEAQLPLNPKTMIAMTAVTTLAAQIRAVFVIRGKTIEITSRQRIREREFAPPIFSPHGAFVAFAEGGWPTGKLHVVDCIKGQRIATLPIHPEALSTIEFTENEELMYFFASKDSQPLLTVWDPHAQR